MPPFSSELLQIRALEHRIADLERQWREASFFRVLDHQQGLVPGALVGGRLQGPGDAIGVGGAMKLMGTSGVSWVNSTIVGVAGPPLGGSGVGGEVSLASVTWTLTQTTSMLLIGIAAGDVFTTAGVVPNLGPIYIRVGGLGNSGLVNLNHSLALGATIAPTSGTIIQHLNGIGKGTYTADLWWNSISVNERLDLYTALLYVFAL